MGSRNASTAHVTAMRCSLIRPPPPLFFACCAVHSLVTLHQLKQLFSAYGLVTESKILMDKIQNKPKG